MNPSLKPWALGAALLLALPGLSGADERHFGYSYESDVMPDGGKDLEVYNTFRYGRDHFYSGWDQSLEFEIGLKGNVSTSLYLNYTQFLEYGVNNPQFNGIANEWRFKLSDSVADPLGFGVLFEPEIKPDEMELETKLIVDKRAGDLLWTFNLTTEPEYHLVDSTWGLTLTPSFGIGLFTSDHFLIGLESELRNFFVNSSPSQPLRQTASIFSMGPNIVYTADDWWITLSILPQVANLMGSGLDFTNTDTGSQRWQVRLDASIHLTTPLSSTTIPTTSQSGPSEPGPSATPAPQPKPRAAAPSNFQEGKRLYAQSCIACHTLYQPTDYTSEGWESIMDRMQRKAHIDDTTKDLILNYLIAAATQDPTK